MIQDIMQRPLTDEERRHPAGVFLDAVARLDQLMTTAKFDNDGAYVDLIDKVVRAPKALADTRIMQQIADQHERNPEREGR